MADRSAIAWQLVKFQHGRIAALELSAWARKAIVENDNLAPALPVGEHDFLEDILTSCLLSEAQGFEIFQPQVAELLQRLTAEPEPSRGTLLER
jgi:hypothetical protein